MNTTTEKAFPRRFRIIITLPGKIAKFWWKNTLSLYEMWTMQYSLGFTDYTLIWLTILKHWDNCLTQPSVLKLTIIIQIFSKLSIFIAVTNKDRWDRKTTDCLTPSPSHSVCLSLSLALSLSLSLSLSLLFSPFWLL